MLTVATNLRTEVANFTVNIFDPCLTQIEMTPSPIPDTTVTFPSLDVEIALQISTIAIPV